MDLLSKSPREKKKMPASKPHTSKPVPGRAFHVQTPEGALCRNHVLSSKDHRVRTEKDTHTKKDKTEGSSRMRITVQI